MNLRIPLANRNPANIKKCLENRNQLTQLQLRLGVARLRTSRLLKEDDVSEISIILFQQTTRNHPQTETTDFSWTAELLNDYCYISKPVHLKTKTYAYSVFRSKYFRLHHVALSLSKNLYGMSAMKEFLCIFVYWLFFGLAWFREFWRNTSFE